MLQATSVLKQFSKSIALLAVNFVLYVLEVYISVSRYGNLGFQSLENYLLYVFLYRPLILLLLAVIHVLLVIALTSSITIGILNRVLFYLQVVLLKCEEFSLLSIGKEGFAYLVSLFIARLLLSMRFPGERFREIGGSPVLIKAPSIKRPSLNDIIEVAPTLLASHSIGFSLLILLTITLSIIGGISTEKLLYAFLPHLYLQPLLLALSVVYTCNRDLREVLLIGFFSGAGLLGVPPLLLTIPRERLHPQRAERVFYNEPPGIFIGIAEAEIAYGQPRRVYAEISQGHVLGSDIKETWFFRETRKPIYVRLEDLNTPHIVIIGASGTGKTTLVKHIVQESSRIYGYRFLVIDPHGEYSNLSISAECRVIDASKYTINPLILEKSSPRDRALQLSHVIASIFKLGFIQRRLLEEVILKAYATRNITDDPETWSKEPPTLRDLVVACKELSELNQEFTRILPYLNLISESMGEGEPLSIDDLLRGNSIVDLSRVSSDFTKAILVETLMYMLISKMYRAGKIPLQLVIDEVRHIMPRTLGMELLSRMFMESRKFGFSIIVVSQDIKRIPQALLNNAGLRVFFTLNEPESVKAAADIVGGAIKVKAACISEALRSLKQHSYIIHATGSENIYIAKIDLAK
ncbi:MAG: ATP-binding protein [Desulfurococcaceae archaeon]|nr:ATP-binding protein [Desulfurococcaceae archaeon]